MTTPGRGETQGRPRELHGDRAESECPDQNEGERPVRLIAGRNEQHDRDGDRRKTEEQ